MQVLEETNPVDNNNNNCNHNNTEEQLIITQVLLAAVSSVAVINYIFIIRLRDEELYIFIRSFAYFPLLCATLMF